MSEDFLLAIVKKKGYSSLKEFIQANSSCLSEDERIAFEKLKGGAPESNTA